MKTLGLFVAMFFLNVTICLAQYAPIPSATPPAPNNIVVAESATKNDQVIDKPLTKLSSNLAEYRDNFNQIDVYTTVSRTDQISSPKFRLMVVFRERLWEDDSEQLLREIVGYIDGRQLQFIDVGSASVSYKNELVPSVLRTQNFAFEIPEIELNDFTKVKNLTITVNNIEVNIRPEKILVLRKFISDEI